MNPTPSSVSPNPLHDGVDTDALAQLVADTDTGGRKLHGMAARVVASLCILWSLAQLYYASPLPFALNFGIIDDTRARSLHLAIGIFLAFVTFPAFKGRSPRRHVPLTDWLMAAAGAFCAASAYPSRRRPGWNIPA